MKFERTNLVGGAISRLSLPNASSDLPGSLAAVEGNIKGRSHTGSPIVVPRRIGRLFDFTSHTFTTAGRTGPEGPTLAQVRRAYGSSGWWNDDDFLSMEMQGIQIWTVPRTGRYRVECAGGGHNREHYHGALMRGTFSLDVGERLNVLCGQSGRISGAFGGSFLFRSPGTVAQDCLIAAGGAGNIASFGQTAANMNGTASPSGNAGQGARQSYNGGDNGEEGEGYATSGNYRLLPASGFIGGEGRPALGGIGAGPTGGPGHISLGGFGGGGVASTPSLVNPELAHAAGGGGYSGGGGAYGTGPSSNRGVCCGGGGGSINRGTNQQNESGANAGPGYVKITWLGE